MPKIFISHTQADRKLAEALRDLLRDGLGSAFQAEFSSDEGLNSGIDKGAPWQEWIHSSIGGADQALVVLTPRSVVKPWVLWESGAFVGVELVAKKNVSPRLMPVLFGLSPGSIPGPLSPFQTTDGTSSSDVVQLLGTLSGLYRDDVDMGAWQNSKEVVSRFVSTTRALRQELPIDRTPAAIQEWIERLDAARARHGPHRVRNLHRWLRQAFVGAIDDAAPEEAVDPRLHRRMGEMYLDAGDPNRAITQFELSLEDSRRDVYVLRALGQALIKAQRLDEAHQQIERIRQLDEQAFSRSPDCAGLLGSYHRARHAETANEGELRKARAAYQAGLDKHADETYLADNVAQVSLMLGDPEAAAEAFRTCLRIISDRGLSDSWSQASRLTAALFLGQREEAEQAIETIRLLRVPPAERVTIAAGLERIWDAAAERNAYDETLDHWLAALKR